MAINRGTFYPNNRWDVTVGQPDGGFKNRSGELSEDGSYIEAAWANDWAAFFSSLIQNEGADGQQDEVGNSQLFKGLINLIVPVNIVIKAAVEAPDLSIVWPGTTWEQVGQGRYIMGAGIFTDPDGTQKVIGPENLPEGRYLHTLDATEMPVHSHQVNVRSNKGAGGSDEDLIGSTQDTGGNRGTSQAGGLAGVTQAHNNMPPGYAFYYYKRTS